MTTTITTVKKINSDALQIVIQKHIKIISYLKISLKNIK